MAACCATASTESTGFPASGLAELADRFGAVHGRRWPPAMPPASTASTTWSTRGRPCEPSKTFAEGLGQAHDHVLVLGIGGSALGTKALLNALRPPAWNELDDEGREFFPRLTVLENVDPATVFGGAAADRSPARAGQRHQQVGRHRRDHGAVSGGPRLARGSARAGRAPAPRVHHRSGPGRAARAGAAGRDRHPGRAARRRWPLQRPLAGGSAPGGAGRDRHRGAPPRRAARRGAFRDDDLLQNPAGAVRRTAVGRRHIARRQDPRADAVRGSAAGIRRVVSAALGGEPGQAGRPPRPAGPRRAHAGRRPSAPPTSTARCSSSWKARSTRCSPSCGWKTSAPTCRSPAGSDLPPDLAYLPGHTLGELLRAEYGATSAALSRWGG